MSRPNLVYVFADQLRASALGYAGDTQAITPHFDAFAAQATDFSNAVATAPVCAAYRATLFTGKYTTSHGMVINELRLNPNQRCFGHVLTAAGYQTSYIGKWHLYANELGHHTEPRNSFVPRGPHRLGFDGEWKAYNFHHVNYGNYYHTDSPEKHFYGEGAYEPEAQSGFAIDFIQRAKKSDQPFALFMSWGPPHDPWDFSNVPERFAKLFASAKFPNPPNYRAENDEPYCDNWARLEPAERAELEQWRRGYYAQVASIDECFGKLMKALQAAGCDRDTVVVFTSDHGEMFGAHGRRAKNIFYEEACRVPLLIRMPGQTTARKSDVCIGTVDLLQTLSSALGLQAPASAEGMDLGHCLRGGSGPEPEAAFMQNTGACAAWEDGHEWRALRSKQFTYARYRADGSELLFDNQNDPYQLNNLATDPARAGVLAHFRKLLADKMSRINDRFESCTWYRDHWTDGKRNIARSATSEF